MPNMPGDTFISKGIKFVLDYGPKGNLRPYTVGPVTQLAKKAGPLLAKLGLPGLVVGAAALVGVTIWAFCREKEEDQ